MNNNLIKEISNGIMTVISWVKIVWEKLPEDIKPGISTTALIGVIITLIRLFFPKRK